MRSPEQPQSLKTKLRREEEAAERELIRRDEGVPIVLTEIDGKEWAGTLHELPRPWLAAKKSLEELDAMRERIPAPMHEIMQIKARCLLHPEKSLGPLKLTAYPEFLELFDEFKDTPAAAEISFTSYKPEKLDDDEYVDGLRGIIELFYESGQSAPSDPDELEDFQSIRRKIERRIAEVQPNSAILSKVAERYYSFSRFRNVTLRKYRRNIGLLIRQVGDIPIQHVTPSQLRTFRDSLLEKMLPASVQATFTPIKGLFGFALDDALIDVNPVHGVKLPRDRRSIETRKWLPFNPNEFSRIMTAVNTIWANEVRGLSDERREAIRMVVRVLAFTAMRPSEVIRLKHENVSARSIQIVEGKAAGSSRVIPLHPEIADFPDWLRNGGLDTFQHITKDPVEPVRHNFLRLIREIMNDSIVDPKKSLYPFRSTFSNAMRRAGADNSVRRAILGHVEAGALRHYDDGPEFELKRKWVEITNPRDTYRVE